MGTSKNYPSPNTPRWNAVRVCYKNKLISEDRVTTEIWRAATTENKELANMLSSEILYKCNQIVESSASAIEAYKSFNQEIISTKQSTIVTEFAKRAIVQSYNEGEPANNWRKNFVSEMTDYFVSRDVAGYYGKDTRNSNIKDLIAFKSTMRAIVNDKVGSVSSKINSIDDWKTFINSTLIRLKGKG